MIPKNLLIAQNNKKSMVKKGRKGTAERPRLSINRSNRYLFAQLIDDQKGKTLIAVSLKDLAQKEKSKPAELAFAMGELIAEKALKKNIKSAIFDRGNFRYHGKVKNIAEG